MINSCGIKRLTLALNVAGAISACSFDERTGGTGALDASQLEDAGDPKDARTVDAAMDAMADASLPPSKCASMSDSIQPLLHANFQTSDLTHVSLEGSASATFSEGGSNIIKDTTRDTGPCEGAWRFPQSIGESDYLNVAGLQSDAATLRAVVELPNYVGSRQNHQAIFSKTGVSTPGRFTLAAQKSATGNDTHLRLIVLDATTRYAVCSPLISDNTIEVQVFLGLGDAARMYWRPWENDDWGDWQEAAEGKSNTTTLFGAGYQCDLPSTATTVSQTSNDRDFAIGHYDAGSESGNYNYTGWISDLEYYGERLDEPTTP